MSTTHLVVLIIELLCLKVYSCQKILLFVILSFSILACTQGNDVDDPNVPQPTPTPTPSDLIDVTTSPSAAIQAVGGEATIEFIASADWSASTSSDWISISPISGTAGSRKITIKVVENTTYEERNGSVIIKSGSESQSVKITQEKREKDIEDHKYVDLGLSVKWATCNVGADKPEDYGGYYAWGETTTKSRYDWYNCFDYLDVIDDWNIYKIGGKTKLEPNSGHDTARENWGGTWRMPTVEELEELYSRCGWKRSTKGNHDGYVVTGPNGNSIFLPAAGYRYDARSVDLGESGSYWSSTLSSSNSRDAQDLYFSRGYLVISSGYRWSGRSVRPVTE